VFFEDDTFRAGLFLEDIGKEVFPFFFIFVRWGLGLEFPSPFYQKGGEFPLFFFSGRVGAAGLARVGRCCGLPFWRNLFFLFWLCFKYGTLSFLCWEERKGPGRRGYSFYLE